MYLVRDVLDKQVVDHRQARIGKVDGLVLTTETDGRLKIGFIEMGYVTLLRRLSLRLSRRLPAFFHMAPASRDWHPYRIPWSKVTDVGVDIEVDIDDSETPLGRTQEWLRQHIFNHIPGGRS